MLRDLRNRLQELTEIDAISGDERPLVRYLRTTLTPHADEFSVDIAGNAYAVKRATTPGPTVMIAAHTDEIGLMVKSIEPGGFVRFEKVGGVIDSLLPARAVRVRGVNGVIGMKAGHYQTEQERLQGRKASDLYIDLGCQSAAEVESLGVRGGLVAAFTVQEEVGLKGAKLAAERWKPDLALALDTMPTGDTPDMSEHRDLNVRLGAGPALQVLAGPGGRANLLHPAVKEFVLHVAREQETPIQLCVFNGGSNDSASMAWAGMGYAAGSLTLPRRYSHSPMELADLRDAISTYQLLTGVLDRMNDLPSFDFLSED